jgi:hypothetical protein
MKKPTVAKVLGVFALTGLGTLLMNDSLASSPSPTKADLQNRITSRTFPSVFQAWNPATPLPGKNADEMLALHDLWFASTGQLGLAWDSEYEGEGTTFTAASLRAAARKIAELRRLDPRLVIIAELRYRDAPPRFFPTQSPYWMRDPAGQPIIGWKEGGYFKIDFDNLPARTLIVRRARALVETGLIDGVMLDWWTDDHGRLELIQALRKAVGDKLILVNGNDNTFPLTAPFVNGTYMECWRSPEDWARMSATLLWAEQHTRAPRINCMETWFHQSRRDLGLMRATTTLALTQSDGYTLFGDPDELPTPDHLHDWYSFWDKGLGTPLSAGFPQSDKSWRREFTNGTVVYNPIGNAGITVRFKDPHISRATGKVALEHQIPPCDGDILIQSASQ